MIYDHTKKFKELKNIILKTSLPRNYQVLFLVFVLPKQERSHMLTFGEQLLKHCFLYMHIQEGQRPRHTEVTYENKVTFFV